MGVKRHPQTGVTLLQTPTKTAPAPANEVGWETRLYTGLLLPGVPGEVRAALANALGDLGVEAEFFLLLLIGFPGVGAVSHARGEIFLSRLEAAARRLYRIADALEIATQSYLTAMEQDEPDLHAAAAGFDPWWPDSSDFILEGEPIELRLRRCGYAYRHVVDVHLATNIEAIANQMALVLHALATLPPAGVLPARSLYQGLYELSSAFQGYIIPHHIVDPDLQTPGLLSSIARLRRLDAEETTSIQSDLLWAQAQLDLAQGFLHEQKISHGERQYALEAVREWQGTITTLASLAQSALAN